MHTCSTWSEDVRVVLGESSYFFINLFHFLTFPGPISIGIDTLWAQLLLEFSTNHFETMHICPTWSEDVRVVLGLSSYHTDLKVTALYKAMTSGDACPQRAFINCCNSSYKMLATIEI